jgi:two-component system cell cycle sensor histidine kinase/response regulator CckA
MDLERTMTPELSEKLGHLEEEHQLLLDHIPDSVVCILDADLRFVHINQVLESLGWKVEDILGRTVDEVMLDRPDAVAAYRAALAGEPQTLDYTSLKGERDFWVQIFPLRRGNEIYGVMSIHQDVTERTETERRRREETDEFESAFRHAAIGMAVADLDGNWLKVNQRLCDLVGYTEAELLELSFQKITHPGDLEHDLERTVKLLAGEVETMQLEKRYLRKDGSIVPVLVSVSLVRDREGTPVRFVGQIQDRTNDEHRRALEHELAERRRDDSLTVLAGGVAHDFNNLLVGILGHTSMALGELPEGSRARHHLEQVESSARRVAEVTDQMLAFSGNSWRELVDIDLGEHAREVADRLRASSPEVKVHLSTAPDVPAVRADLKQLQRITSNLVDNAVEALEGSGGMVSVSTGAVHLTRATLDSYSVGAEASPGFFSFVEIGDDGCGMNEDVRGQMFEPFFTTKFQGRGLGLAAVDGWIRGHGGALAVHSVPGTGTRMRVLLPAAAA